MDRFRVRRGLLALAIGGVAVAPLTTAPARAATATVTERGSSFDPSHLEIRVGDTVVWTYQSAAGGPGHTVTFEGGPDYNEGCERNALLPINCQTASSTRPQRTFTSSDLQGRSQASFPYYCKIHGAPGGVGMSGVIVLAAAPTTTVTAVTTSSTLARATTTSATAKASTSSTTSTTRALATSSTLASSSTTSTTADTSSVLLPGDAPPFSGDDINTAAGQSGGSDDGTDSKTVALIVVLLLAVSGAGGFLLWRLRPGRA